MKLIFTATALASILLCNRAARAEDAGVLGAGYQVGERTVLHPTVEVQTGVISNVFYDDLAPVASGLLRLLGEVELSPLDDTEGQSGTPPDIEFSAGLRFEYEEYLSTNLSVQAQRNLGLGADLTLGIKPSGTFPLILEDHFIRTNRPTNFESSRVISRDINTLSAGLRYVPEGRNISGRLKASNYIEIFESGQSSFANRTLNKLEMGVDWQFLPITKFYVEGSYGLNSGLGASTVKSSSTPMNGRVGIATAITERITTKASGGYAYSSYSSGIGYSSYIYHLEGGYRYSPVGRVQLIFDRDFRDSINADFYGEYQLKLVVDQQISRVIVSGGVAAYLRNYQGGLVSSLGGGMTTRDDVAIDATVKASYDLKDWLALNASYNGVSVQTKFVSTVPNGRNDDPSYIRHQVMVGASGVF